MTCKILNIAQLMYTSHKQAYIKVEIKIYVSKTVEKLPHKTLTYTSLKL